MLSSIIIGGGPGGLGPLIWAAQHGVLANWLDQGIAIVDREEHLGGGLGRYAINSDSLGGSYLEFLDAPALPDRLRCLHDDPVTREMAQYRDGFPPLPLVDRFMRRVGMAMETILADRPAAVFHRRTEARALQLRSDGLVTVETVLIDGSRRILTARSAVIALGGRQSTEQALLPDLTLAACQPRHLMSSDHLLSHAGLEQAEHLLAAAGRRQIVVLGGSHSAYSVAWALLRMPAAARLAPGQIMIIQRRPPPIFYPDRQDAEADLYLLLRATSAHAPSGSTGWVACAGMVGTSGGRSHSDRRRCRSRGSSRSRCSNSPPQACALRSRRRHSSSRLLATGP